MKKLVNGEYVDMTEDEFEAWKAEIDAMPPLEDETPEAIVDILTGVSE